MSFRILSAFTKTHATQLQNTISKLHFAGKIRSFANCSINPRKLISEEQKNALMRAYLIGAITTGAVQGGHWASKGQIDVRHPNGTPIGGVPPAGPAGIALYALFGGLFGATCASFGVPGAVIGAIALQTSIAEHEPFPNDYKKE